MKIQASLVTFVLGLLPCVVVNAAEVPLYSTLRTPFTISVQDGFNIQLKYSEKYHDYEPVISNNKATLPEFKLTAGNLTTFGGPVKEGYTAFSGPVPKIYPPRLTPIFFGKEPPRVFTTPIVAFTHRTGILRLWSINGRKFCPFSERSTIRTKTDAISILLALVVRKLENNQQVRLQTPDSAGRSQPCCYLVETHI